MGRGDRCSVRDERALARDTGLADRTRLAARHPLRCLHDVRARRGFAAQDVVPLRVLAPVALIVADEVDAARALREGRDRLGAARD